MTHLATFLAECDTVADQLGIAQSTLATKLFDDGKRLAALKSGRDIGVRRLERARADLEKLKAGMTGGSDVDDAAVVAPGAALGAGAEPEKVQ